jgi:hypothetical protein
MSHLHSAGAFVVQLHAQSDFDAGRVEGRVEHVASGRTANFGSASQLLESLAQLWKSAPANRHGLGEGDM